MTRITLVLGLIVSLLAPWLGPVPGQGEAGTRRA